MNINKRGDIEFDQLGTWVIVLVTLVVLTIGAIILFKGKGGDILASIKNMMRFG